jgi:hypothetical protein
MPKYPTRRSVAYASYKKAAAKYVMSKKTSDEKAAIMQMLTALLHEGKHEGEEFLQMLTAMLTEFCRTMQVLLDREQVLQGRARAQRQDRQAMDPECEGLSQGF